ERRDLFPDRKERLVDEHEPIVRVVDDEGELFRMKAKVERVQHRARQRDAEVGLEVLIMIPAERGDAVTRLDASLLERTGKAAGSDREVADGVPMQRLVRAPRDDLTSREHSFRVPEDRRQRQG